MKLEVFKIEFEFSEASEFGNTYFRTRYIQTLEKYVPTVKSKIKSYVAEENKLVIEFKNPISLHSVNNSISLFVNNMNVNIDEIEYDIKNKTVEVEINDE